MDALKLYSHGYVPTQEKTRVIPRKKQKLTPTQFEKEAAAVDYMCFNCNTKMTLCTNESIKCASCDNRIMLKIKNKNPQTYDTI